MMEAVILHMMELGCQIIFPDGKWLKGNPQYGTISLNWDAIKEPYDYELIHYDMTNEGVYKALKLIASINGGEW